MQAVGGEMGSNRVCKYWQKIITIVIYIINGDYTLTSLEAS